VVVAVSVGVPLVLLAPRLGRAIFDFYVGVRKRVHGSPASDAWWRVLSWPWGVSDGPSPYVAFFRAAGVFLVVAGIVLLTAYLTGSIVAP
jgi:hypothetical protein